MSEGDKKPIEKTTLFISNLKTHYHPYEIKHYLEGIGNQVMKIKNYKQIQSIVVHVPAPLNDLLYLKDHYEDYTRLEDFYRKRALDSNRSEEDKKADMIEEQCYLKDYKEELGIGRFGTKLYNMKYNKMNYYSNMKA